MVTILHDSDCAVHNEPATPNGPCDCGAAIGPKPMTLFWHKTGPMLSYRDGVLHVSDLNPQVETKWGMGRLEMWVLGWRCIKAALS